MKILVLNSGSSSIKYQLFRMTDEAVLAKGMVQRIGIQNSFLDHKTISGEEIHIDQAISDHNKGIQLVMETLLHRDYGVLQDITEISAIGHRVVHGGEKFKVSTLINDEVIAHIESVSDLAPLHNPHNLSGIRICSELLQGKPQVAVFDTVFHQTMEKEAYMYALPYKYYTDYGIRKYGFHGTSHKYVANRCAVVLGKPLSDLKLISCHLGNGASVTAIRAGKSIDTSMGLTPLEGLVMGTRCGDLDPAIIPYIMEKENLTSSKLDSLLNKESGLLGLSGISNDVRDIEEAAQAGDERAIIALNSFIYRIQKYIGAYIVAMGGIDAIIFTAGVGENQSYSRKLICDGLAFLGVDLDSERNTVKGEEQVITTSDSLIKVLVVPTDEELMIAKDTADLVEKH